MNGIPAPVALGFLTAVNAALILVTATHSGPAAPPSPPVLRASGLELVGRNGVVRATIKMEPAGDVVFRLMDETGTIRVKLGASRDGSGLVLVNDATELGVQILAKATGTSVKLRDGARERMITP